MGPFLNEAIAAIISVIANVVYWDMKRKGVRGWGRMFAFFAGNPMTWITFFFVAERPVLRFEPPPDDERALLAEIHRDRALRARSAPPEVEPDPGGHEAQPEV